MASGRRRSASAVFHQFNKPGSSSTTAPYGGDSVLGGAADGDLATDSVLDGIEGEYEPSLMTDLSDIGPRAQLRDRRSDQPFPATQQQNGAGESPDREIRGATGGAARTRSSGDPELQAQLAGGDRGSPGGASPSLSDLAINSTPAKFQAFSTPWRRLLSYTRNWPTDASQKPEDLADAGFYYTGQGDCVRCFHCGVGLKSWDPRDSPWVEHARHWPACQFLCSVKSTEFATAVQAVSARTTDPNSSPIQLSEVEEEMRRTTSQTDQLASWCDENDATGEEKDTDTSDSDVEQRAAELARENDRLRARKACKICMENDVSIVFLPCGHFATCGACAPALPVCPMCMQRIKGKVRAQMC